VEEDRLLPLALTKDTSSGYLHWSSHYLVNPWLPNGQLVDLTRYPRLAAYFEANAAALLKRNVANRLPGSWFRTIDKVDHALTAKAKLLFPDMKMETHPVLDPGGLYPHHNLYFVVSGGWDLRVLGGLLLSKVTQFFIDSYAVKMRNRTLRFQAQYLRRIRVPRPDQIPPRLVSALSVAFDRRDSQAATAAAFDVYGITEIPE
jgi:adenine-specific DNA-methyltransferase